MEVTKAVFQYFLKSMGLGQSRKYVSESDLSEDDLDISHFRTPPVESGEMSISDSLPGNTLDAVRRHPLANVEDILSYKKLSSIENKLDEFEVVSLIYLLYESAESGLQVLSAVIDCGKNEGLLYDWAQSERSEDKKKSKKLVEALCIVQNYQVLSDLGYDKRELQQEYMPSRVETSVAVNRMRKTLYLIAEKLTQDQMLGFINNMRKKLSDPLPNFGHNYLERYFLYWEHNNVGIKQIQQAFKTMGLETCYDDLDFILPSVLPAIPTSLVLQENALELRRFQSKPIDSRRKTSTTQDNTYLQLGSSEDVSFSQPGTSGTSLESSFLMDINRYPIDPQNPGLLLIINQESFYTEMEEQYKHLLHENKDQIQLTSRMGTEVDEKRLERLFTRMGFTIHVERNLPHYQMLSLIQNVTDEISHESSLIICILSHGNQGVVYGSNSCKVKVRDIEHIMCKRNKNLAGKPKVLILQACQGEKCQNIKEESTDDEDDSNATDGPSRASAIVDLLSFWATIPGFAAIRNMKTGSWFIQALCEEIEQGSTKLHFSDICTRVVKNVTRQEWKEKTRINVMTPKMESTLTQSFFLPPLKKN